MGTTYVGGTETTRFSPSAHSPREARPLQGFPAPLTDQSRKPGHTSCRGGCELEHLTLQYCSSIPNYNYVPDIGTDHVLGCLDGPGLHCSTGVSLTGSPFSLKGPVWMINDVVNLSVTENGKSAEQTNLEELPYSSNQNN